MFDTQSLLVFSLFASRPPLSTLMASAPKIKCCFSGGGNVVIAMLQKPGKSDRVYTPTKLAAIIDTVVAGGVSPTHALAGVGVSQAELLSPHTRVSVQQVLIACGNAIRLSRDPSLAFRAGASMHVSSFGMYGFAILSSADFRKTMSFCERYHVLATPLVMLRFREEHGLGIWSIDPIADTPVNDSLYRFIVEMQMGVILSVLRDVMGASFSPNEVALTYSRQDDFEPAKQFGKCRIIFDRRVNEFIFEATWLDASAELGNRTTYALVESLCDGLVAEMSQIAGVAGRVRALLLQDVGRQPSLTAVAGRLKISERTLRRRLAHQGVSFRGLLAELRVQLAVRYLRETSMNNDDIAVAIGFRDPANFRHAFRRWSGHSPSVFRRTPPLA
jgi:AraC-like DNA-binding protein